VKEGAAHWQADSGQYLLAFEGDPADGSLSVIESGQEVVQSGAVALFERASAMERDNAGAAIALYQQAIAADPRHLDAWINLGLLLHESGRTVEAERAYRAALAACGSDPVVLFNLGVLLEDMDRKLDALASYEAALEADPRLADGHYNLGLLCEQLGRPKEAIRHMSQYRRLMGRKT
jgi:tetratricopeptide (TPR) repeat protein